MKYIAIIPARYASSRFPGKPLAEIDGVPMIVRVVRQALQAIADVVVATDDERILKVVTDAGHRAVMTSPSHRSGTDRCLEAYDNVGSDASVVINVQGDEPFISPSQIELLKGCFSDDSVDIATLIRPYDRSASYQGLANPNAPKVVVADDGSALYFSRSVIPYLRGVDPEEWPARHQYYTHVGMYAYRADALRRVVAMPQSSLELAESLEQLRWLQGGMKIATAVTSEATIGIDTPSDLEAALRFLKDPTYTSRI